MPKNNRRVPWSQMVADEAGFHAATDEGIADGQEESSHRSVNVSMEQIGRGFQADERRNVIAYRDQTNDVLYVHPTDHPGMNLTTDFLSGVNFHSWCRSIRRGLAAKNKLDFIDPTIIEPNAHSIDYKQWLRVDFLVFSWIINSINKEIGRGLQHIETSKDLWAELHRRFGKANGPRLYKLRRELATYSQGNQLILMYYNSLQSLWDEINLLVTKSACTCDANELQKQTDEEEKLMQFLMGLNDCYEAIRNQILLLEPLPSVSQAYSMVIQVEEQNCVASQFPNQVEHNALYTSQNQRSYMNKYAGFKRRLSKEEKMKLKCSHCGGNGHEKGDCFELVGVPEWYQKFKQDRAKARANCIEEEDCRSMKEEFTYPTVKPQLKDGLNDMSSLIQTEIAKYIGKMMQQPGSRNTLEQSNAANLVELDENDAVDSKFMGHYAFGIMSGISKCDWIIDSGASVHMCCNIDLMISMIKLDEPQKVFLPDRSSIMAHYSGKVQLTDLITLHKVLYAPCFTHNLISVSELTRDIAGKVLFLPNHCLIQTATHDHFLGIGKLKGRLYVVQHHSADAVYSHQVSSSPSLQSWHDMLGHPSIGAMKHFPHLKRKFSTEDFTEFRSCETCHKSKQQRLPFPVLKRRSSIPFELIHTDIWGPYQDENIAGTPYILTIVEDSSRTTWTYLMQSKTQVSIILKSFFAMVRTQFNSRVKILRSDNGTEFLGAQTQALLQAHGIIHQRSCTYSPQQNGVVERKHKHLLQVARALMFTTNMPGDIHIPRHQSM